MERIVSGCSSGSWSGEGWTRMGAASHDARGVDSLTDYGS